MELTWKEKGGTNCQAHPIKVNVWGCFSSKDFGHIVCFKQNLNAELISKRGLLSTVPKQFGHDSMSLKLQEDNESKHTWKRAVKWKRNNVVHEIHYHLILHSSKTYGNYSR